MNKNYTYILKNQGNEKINDWKSHRIVQWFGILNKTKSLVLYKVKKNKE